MLPYYVIIILITIVVGDIMQEPPRALIAEIYEMLGEKNKEKMILHLYGDNENLLTDVEDYQELFENYLKNLIASTFFNNDDIIDIAAEIRSSYYRKRQLTKKNWFKALQRDVENNKKTPIHQEIEVLKKLLDREKNKEEVIKIFSGNASDIKEPEDLLKIRLKEIENWSKDKTTLLSDYPYLETKSKYQLERAFEVDLISIASEILANKPRNWVFKYPEEPARYPVFADGTFSKKGNLRINPDTKKRELYDEITLSDGNKFIYSFVQANEDEKVTISRLPFLDDIDNAIILHILKNIDQQLFYSEKKVRIDFRDIVIEAYKSDSNKAYRLTESRILNLTQYYFQGEVVNKENQERVKKFSFNFFQSAEIAKDPATGKLYVEIVFSDRLHQQYINDQTINIYSHIIDKLENKISKILVFAFQKERIDAYLQGRPIRKTYDYNFFSDRIRFRSKKVETNLNLIQSSLEEFVTLNILINGYKRVGNGFEIHLMPLTEDERIDLFSDSNKHLLLG